MKAFKCIYLAGFLLCLLILAGCKSDNGVKTEEENLVVTTSPSTLNNNVEAPAPGPDFSVQVTVTSKMPEAGVKIDVLAREENATTPFFTDSKTGSAAQQTFSITGTPKTIACIVEITVTSNSKPSNKWTGSYRYSRK